MPISSCHPHPSPSSGSHQSPSQLCDLPAVSHEQSRWVASGPASSLHVTAGGPSRLRRVRASLLPWLSDVPLSRWTTFVDLSI